MNRVWLHKTMLFTALVLAAIAIFVLVEYWLVVHGGTAVPAPDIPRQAQVFGTGKTLNYLVLGDSTSIGQGADYASGIAIGTSKHLAKNAQVSMTNLGESGARAADVKNFQMPKITQTPDVVLISIGANDVTHLTSLRSQKKSLQVITSDLIKRNCNVKIVFTGSPAMGSVHRFPQPLRWAAGYRAGQINNLFIELNKQNNTTLAPLAASTGRQFSKDASLSAADKFHPSAAGYALWIEVLNKSLDQALAQQPSHCN